MRQYAFNQAVYIGRFQPFHNGHAALVAEALSRAERVILVLGSSFVSRSPKNPFTWEERANIIRATLSDDDAARIDFVPVRDYYEDERWVKAVREGVQALAKGPKTCLVGHFKDDSSYYLNRFPGWELVTCPRAGQIDATALREVLFDEEAMPAGLAMLSSRVPKAVVQSLAAFWHLPEYAQMLAEFKRIKANKAAWAGSPYEPIFSTVDAVVKMQNKVLLIRRAQDLGQGLLALPGGFVEPRERLLASAVRELQEETNFGLYEATLISALADVKVFDHPDRSLRGRTITHAHFFDLKDMRPLEVHGNGTEGKPFWVDVSELASLEDQFFEDHFHILDYFLKVSN